MTKIEEMAERYGGAYSEDSSGRECLRLAFLAGAGAMNEMAEDLLEKEALEDLKFVSYHASTIYSSAAEQIRALLTEESIRDTTKECGAV